MRNMETPTSDTLSRYLVEIRAHPLLTAGEEDALARRWRDEGDQDAQRRLIASHLRLVVKIARGFSGYGMPLADLIAQGNLGLVQAAEKFDPDRGFRFSTYAIWWIRAAIQEYVLYNASLVKMGTTAAQKKLFFNLRRMKARLGAYEDEDLPPETVAEIARELQVNEEEVVEMNRRIGPADLSLQGTLRTDSDEEWQNTLVDPTPDQESMVAERDELSQRRDLLERALGRLDTRERHILVERRLKEEPPTLEELSQHYGISRERVRQLEKRAFEKLGKAMRSMSGALRGQVGADLKPDPGQAAPA